MVPNRRTEEKERDRGVEIRPLFISLSLQFFGLEPYAALLKKYHGISPGTWIHLAVNGILW